MKRIFGDNVILHQRIDESNGFNKNFLVVGFTYRVELTNYLVFIQQKKYEQRSL